MTVGRKLFVALLAMLLLALWGLLQAMQAQLKDDLAQFQDARQLEAFQPIAKALAQAYEQAGSWQALLADHAQMRKLLGPDLHERPMKGRPMDHQPMPGRPMPEPPLQLLDANGQVIFPLRPRHRFQNRSQQKGGQGPFEAEPDAPKPHWDRPDLHGDERAHRLLIPIVTDKADKPSGWLSVPRREPMADALVLSLYQSQSRTQWWVLAVAFVLALAMAWFLGRYLNRRLSGLVLEIKRLAKGDLRALDQAHFGADEFGMLASHLDDLRLALQNSENFRRQWLADSSHELRTPIAAAKAKLEAMLDGVQPLNQKNLQQVYDAIEQLAQLAEDLDASAAAEIYSLSGQRTKLDFNQLCEKIVGQMQALAKSRGLNLSYSGCGPVILYGDEARLRQLLQNLIGNSIKYTDAPGLIRVALSCNGKSARLGIEDSAPKVDEAQLAHLFDYLYRAENSRNRASGGSGLGLAIVRRIVEAHHGRVSAAASAEGGLLITAILPLEQVDE